MITLENICRKLERILNGIDDEVSSNTPSNENYFFKVFSEGLYLTDLGNMAKGKNFVPVVVGALGGSFNPVPYLEEVDYNIQVIMYYPVRFKNDFYKLNEFLQSAFVGKVLNYETQNALSNISVAQYGELQNIEFREFEKWINTSYKMKVEVLETYMSMSFTLYLNTAKDLQKANGFLMCNTDLITSVKVSKGETTILNETTPVIVQRALVGQTNPATQQELGKNHAIGFGASTSYTFTLPLLVKNTIEYRNLIIELETNRAEQDLEVELTEVIPFSNSLTLTRKYYIVNYSRNNTLGEFVGIQLTLADKE